MKKTVIQIIVCVLCLMLCACGGLSGEKAAELYPDIIGNWGTDPFGEEFVLCLAKDGTCTVLDTPGSWTLDEEQSNDMYVTLTIKTDHAAFTVHLNRVQEDNPNPDNAVELQITDAGQGKRVYHGDVFIAEKQFISAELALQTVPELVDEWGSIYWNEEPALVIREDGTCSVLRQPGRWCLRAREATWPRIDIMIKLDSGEQLYSDFYVLDIPGSCCAALDIYSSDTGIPVYPTDYTSAVSDPIVISRSRAGHASDLASEAIGTWAVAEDLTNPVATFHEDGTCTIRGADGLWSVDYTNMHNLPSDGYWELLAKINDNGYQIYLNDIGNGRFAMSIYSKDMEILPFSDMVKIP